MKQDEFGFFNQQLAAMLRDGIPLEGALKQLCAGMKTGPIRAEMQALEADLAKGTPLKEALTRRGLPEFYKRMVEIGARSNDLAGVLTLLADHYHRANALWTRLKGLMVYPLLVIVVSLGLTLILAMTFSKFLSNFFDPRGWGPGAPPFALVASMWVPPVILALLAALCIAAVSIPGWRAKLRWRLPAFREASLAQLASAVALMLKNGTTLAEALAFAQVLEATTPAGKTLAEWQRLVESGQGKPAQWPPATKPFPPLFLWLVQKGGEDPAAGFQKAAEIYQARAAYRTELALYGALPISMLLLGQMIFWQVAPMMRTLTWLMNTIGDSGFGD
jgi:type II secretory pathway component PulF